MVNKLLKPVFMRVTGYATVMSAWQTAPWSARESTTRQLCRHHMDPQPREALCRKQ